uniref:Protein Wnt n=1 Tax=Clytia hemisphaerica TaxID=252671 RepID=A0A7M5VES1_9CNID
MKKIIEKYFKTSYEQECQSRGRYALMDVFYFERRGAYGRYLRQNPSHSAYVNKGIKRAVSECQNLFKYNRWNCRSNNPHEPFGDVVRKGCRETAFVYALASAGLTYEMVRACSEGRIGCQRTCAEKVNIKETRLLNGTHAINDACNDNLRYGFRTWYDVVFKGEPYSDIRAVFNIKNSIVGYK